jgi:hypothetical protein
MVPGGWVEATMGKTLFICLLGETNLFSRTSRPISIKLGTNHPEITGIKNYTNQGPGPFQRGDNHKKGKIGCGHLKIFSRTRNPEKLRFRQKHPHIV